jgi:hypothetical protein
MSQLQVTGEAKIRDIQGPVVANSGVITALDGDASQYVRGDGTLADFPTSTGGGSSVSYYLNSSVSQGTIGGVAYRELSKEPIIGAGTDIAISSNGYVASYLTDANDPDVVLIPGGNFNCEFYFSVNNNTGNPFTYAELYKYDGTTFTLLGSSVGVPEYINQGTVINPYYFAIPVPTTPLALTDRLAIRIYVNVDGRTVTLHTENGHLCQVVTTLSKGMVSLNNLTDQSQFLTTGTSGTNFAIVSSGDTHTFNLPIASATNTGKLSSTDWSTFNNKVPYTGATADINLGSYGLTTSSLTVTNDAAFNSNILLKKVGLAVTNINLITQFAASSGVGIGYSDGVGGANFTFPTASINTYTFPAASGTIALTSNLSSYVPYTGATANVNLGIYGLLAQAIVVGQTSTQGYIHFKTGGSTALSADTSQAPYGTNGMIYSFDQTGGNYKQFVIDSSLLTNNTIRTYSMPNASGTLALTSDIPSLTGYVPYTGASANLNLGTFDLTADVITGATGSFASNGGSNTFAINHSSGSGIALNITKGGNGEGLYINKTSGSGNAATIIGTLNATTLVKSGGTSSQFLKADGSVDSNSYVTIDTTQTISGAKTFSTTLTVNNTITTSSTSLILQQTGDVYGTTQLLLLNRDGSNGAIFKNLGLDLVDFGFVTSSTAQGNLRFEKRAGNRLTDNTTGEFQFVINASSGFAYFQSGFFATSISQGNLLVGTTTNSIYKLDVNGTGRFSGSITSQINTAGVQNQLILENNSVAAGADGNSIYFKGYQGSLAKISAVGFPNDLVGGYLQLQSYSSNTTANIGLIINQNGNVSINNTNNSYQLDVSGTLRVTGAATFSSSVTATGGFEIPNGQFYRARRSSSNLLTDMIGIPSGSDDVRVLTTGAFNVINGSLSTMFGIASNGAATFSSTGSFTGDSAQVLTLHKTSGGGSQLVMTTTFGNSYGISPFVAGVSNGGFSITDITNNVQRFVITDSTGVIQIANLAGTGSRAVLADASGNLSAPVSDISVKQNITTIGYGLNEILKMNPVWFDFINEYKNYGEGRQNGNIAQEMQEIIPEAVFTTPSTGKMGINYDQMHAVYIKAIQELKAEIEELKLKIK